MLGVSVDFPTTWACLGDIVFRLLRCEPVSRESWNSSFTDVYALCNSRPVSHAPILYSSTASLISSRVKEINMLLEDLSDSELLPAYVQHWEVFHRGLTYLDKLYRFVNQQYVKNLRPTEAEMCYSSILPMADRHTMEILEVGLANWKLYLIDSVKDRLSGCLMREVHNDRLGVVSQQNCISLAIDSFRRVGELRDTEKAGMDIYNKIFQDPLLETTRAFYTNWAFKRESELACAQYITEALVLRDDEETRASHYYKWSYEKIQALFQEIIVRDRLTFLNQSVHQVVAEERKIDLRNLFRLLAPDNLCTELSSCFGQHIMLRIREAINALPHDPNSAPAHFVDSLLSIRSRCIQFVDEIFDGMSLFRNQMDKAFSQAINERSNVAACTSAPPSKSSIPRPSELLCRCMDSLLRMSTKSRSETDLESKLTASITIFKYIDDKDVFQKYYQRMLCKRLISSTPPAMELEESVINQLRAVCGYEFTGKFHRMFNDVQLAPELNRKFGEYLSSSECRFKFSHYFNVLTQCSWPINLIGAIEFKLPDELQQCTTQFETFYTSSYQGRKIRWAHNFSTTDLCLTFADKPYQLQVPAVHAAILLLFDTLDSDVLLLRDLYSSVQLTQDESVEAHSVTSSSSTKVDPMDTTPDSTLSSSEQIHRILAPLIGIGLLGLETDSEADTSAEQLSTETRIKLNRSFTNKRLKLKVFLTSQNKETTQTDVGQVERQVNEDRRFFIQAAIVRIMKSRKQIDHVTLLKTIMQQAGGRFQPSVPLIKRCIENLIDKGYIERSPDDPDHYCYLA
ncbi:cullin 2 [Paragonimus westermani]|uniref:Cullin 2 n=1 Tax=Paragonimus westermani TaxID=34504 RepID=A0A5J4NUB3_9TREM|nr:cullin 2 [Paragonimus westermani]